MKHHDCTLSQRLCDSQCKHVWMDKVREWLVFWVASLCQSYEIALTRPYLSIILVPDSSSLKKYKSLSLYYVNKVTRSYFKLTLIWAGRIAQNVKEYVMQLNSKLEPRICATYIAKNALKTKSTL